MKKFNINNRILIKITDYGWKHLNKTVGDSFIKAHIDVEHNRMIIKGSCWHYLQMHEVFELLPQNFGGNLLFETDILLNDDYLENVKLD